jgi:hypothetical protein
MKEKSAMFTNIKIAIIAASAVCLIGGPAQASMGADLETRAHPHSAPAHHGQRSAAITGTPNTYVALADASKPRAKSGDLCSPILGDGVRIRATPSASGVVLGLAYNGDLLKLTGALSELYWLEGTDTRTGVHGWVGADLVGAVFVDC